VKTLVESQMVVLFGATGDLARRKLIPSLYHLEKKKLLTGCTPIVCLGRHDYSPEGFLQSLEIDSSVENPDPEIWRALAERIEYCRVDLDTVSVSDFRACIDEVRNRYACAGNSLVYLALPTRAFQSTARLLASMQVKGSWLRVVFEKPFGEDVHSATELNANIRSVLSEEQIFRVDHYLGKELVQNILTLRFANMLFASAWDRKTIDHVQITVSETLGVEKRAGYYDRSGAVRDMVQNHLLQLLSFVAMEPPNSHNPKFLRDEAVKVLRYLRPVTSGDVVLGQYREGEIAGERVPGYLQEPGVTAGSTTETYVAFKALIDNERWQGVPFYLRTGKRLRKRFAEIRVVLKRPELTIAGSADGEPNTVIIRIQPDEGIALAFNVRSPGENGQTESVLMDFCHHCHFGPNTPEAYEAILRNVMLGERNVFPRWDWIEASWRYIDGLRSVAPSPVGYAAGSFGPAEAESLLGKDNHSWHEGGGSQSQLAPFPRLTASG
jgi:glucose-6-phosphate 1-dehydrogenase